MTQPSLTWTGDVPVSTQFDDPYYSLDNGLAETRHVFLDGNDLAMRLKPEFHVAEIGVGTGLNLLALAELADTLGHPIRYTGFEAYPLTKEPLDRALTPWNAALPWTQALKAAWPLPDPAPIGRVMAQVIQGDARKTLPNWRGQANAWFLDGFAPAKNPELWEPQLLAQVAAHTSPGGTFATYTAAGHVRRALQQAGFEVTRSPGFGRKRHMSTGRLCP